MKLLLILIFSSFLLFASPANPPLVEGGESYDDISNFTIGSGHSSNINSVAFSADGKYIVSGSGDGRHVVSSIYDNSVKLWSVDDKKLIYSFEEHFETINSVAFSSNGKYIISGSNDNSMKLWSVDDKKLIYSFDVNSDVYSVAFSNDGKYIVSGSSDNSIKLWSLKDKKLIHTFEGHNYGVNSVSFSSDGKYIVSGSDDKSVKLWSIYDRRLVYSFEDHNEKVNSVAFSNDGQYIVSGSGNVYDIVSGVGDNSIKLWSMRDKKLIYSFEDHSRAVLSVAFSNDGKYIVSGSDDKSIKLRSVEKMKLIYSFDGLGNYIDSVVFSNDGQYIVSGSSDNSVKLWSMRDKKLVYSFEGHKRDVRSVAFSSDGAYIVSGSRDNSVKLWSVKEKKLMYTFIGHSLAVHSVAFSNDGKYIVSGSWDKSVKLWSVEEQKLVYTFEGHNSDVRSVAFSNDGKYIVSGSWDKSVKLWSVKEKKLIYTFKGHNAYIDSIALSSDGKYIASGSGDKSVKLWSMEEKKLIYTFEGHKRDVNSVAFSNNGKYIVSCSRDGSIKLWSVKKMKLVHNFEVGNSPFVYSFSFYGGANYIDSVAFSSDGRFIISGGFLDNSIKIWSVKDKNIVADIYSIGDNWAWFTNKTIFRGDDGRLFLDINSSKPMIPKDNTFKDNLDINISKEVDIYSQKHSFIEANITNLDKNISYWISAISNDKNIIIYPNKIIKLSPKESKTLDFNISSALPIEDRKAFTKDINLTFITANGVYETKKIKVNFKTPKMEVKKAKYDSKNKSLIVEILNSGSEAINNLDIKIGKETQKIDNLEANGTVSKSFILSQEPKEVNITISKPFYEWNLQTKVTPQSMLVYYIVLVILILSLLIAIYYFRRYRNPLVVRLSNSPQDIFNLAPSAFPEVKEKLEKVDRLDSVLMEAKIKKQVFLDVMRFEHYNYRSKVELLAKRVNAGLVEISNNCYELKFGDDFLLSIDSLIVFLTKSYEIQDIEYEMKEAQILKGKIVLIITPEEAMENLRNNLTKDKKNLFVSFVATDIVRLFLSPEPIKVLPKIISSQIALTQISPYQVGGGVNREIIFFGREKIISHIINKGVTNYIVIGGRQVGKSSLLKAIERRYIDVDEVECYYISASNEKLVEDMKLLFDQENVSDKKFAKFINSSNKRYLFLIDEADKFIRFEKNNKYVNLDFMRSLSEKNNASFILAGFWEIYRYTYFDYQSPIANFGSLFELGELEWDACIDLATKPMETLGISYDNKKILEEMIIQLGQRANLIQISCEYLIENIAQTQRVIEKDNITKLLSFNNEKLYAEFEKWNQISQDTKEQWMDRVVVYSTIRQNGFDDKFLQSFIKEHQLHIDSNELDKSLARLRIGYIIKKEENRYSYRVPIFRAWIMQNDIEARLQGELNNQRQKSRVEGADGSGERNRT